MILASSLNTGRFAVDMISGPQTGPEGSLVEEARALGIDLKLLKPLVRQVSPVQDLLACMVLYLRLRSRRPDVVHTHSSKAGILGRLAAKLAGVPIVIHTVHGWGFNPHMSRLLSGFYVLMEKLAARVTDAFIAESRRDIRTGVAKGIGVQAKYHLIRSGVRTDAFEPDAVDRSRTRMELGIPPDAPVMGNVGRLSEQKNPSDWVRVASRVVTQIPDCRFLLVGDGPLRRRTEELLKQEGLSDNTVLAGLRRDPARMLAVMDVFLITSLWEGLPNAVLQAMAMKVPVISTDTGSVAEVIEEGETGCIRDHGDIDGLSEAAVHLLESRDNCFRMGRKAREYVLEHFAQGRMITETRALYDWLLETGKAG